MWLLRQALRKLGASYPRKRRQSCKKDTACELDLDPKPYILNLDPEPQTLKP